MAVVVAARRQAVPALRPLEPPIRQAARVARAACREEVVAHRPEERVVVVPRAAYRVARVERRRVARAAPVACRAERGARRRVARVAPMACRAEAVGQPPVVGVDSGVFRVVAVGLAGLQACRSSSELANSDPKRCCRLFNRCLWANTPNTSSDLPKCLKTMA